MNLFAVFTALCALLYFLDRIVNKLYTTFLDLTTEYELQQRWK